MAEDRAAKDGGVVAGHIGAQHLALCERPKPYSRAVRKPVATCAGAALTGVESGRVVSRHTGTQADRQTGRQTGTHTHTDTHMHTDTHAHTQI